MKMKMTQEEAMRDYAKAVELAQKSEKIEEERNTFLLRSPYLRVMVVLWENNIRSSKIEDTVVRNFYNIFVKRFEDIMDGESESFIRNVEKTIGRPIPKMWEYHNEGMELNAELAAMFDAENSPPLK